MKTNFKKSIALAFIMSTQIFMIQSCGGGEEKKEEEKTEAVTTETTETTETLVENTDPMQNKGIGPVTSVTIGDLDAKIAGEGEKIFTEKCSACHKIDAKYVGPALKGVTTRRSPEWIMNMILNPTEMTEKDPDAKALLAEFMSPMANQSLKEEDARKILEYFRSVDSK